MTQARRAYTDAHEVETDGARLVPFSANCRLAIALMRRTEQSTDAKA
jgi:hypothetical protein